jgi:hypothetical protein
MPGIQLARPVCALFRTPCSANAVVSETLLNDCCCWCAAAAAGALLLLLLLLLLLCFCCCVPAAALLRVLKRRLAIGRLTECATHRLANQRYGSRGLWVCVLLVMLMQPLLLLLLLLLPGLGCFLHFAGCLPSRWRVQKFTLSYLLLLLLLLFFCDQVSLKYFEEVFTSAHWMMRVYRVRDSPNRDTPKDSGRSAARKSKKA